MKILIHSNAPWAPTGYGQQTAQLSERLMRDGHDVAISAFYGLSGARLDWNGMPIYPNMIHPYGADVLVGHAQDHFGGDERDGLIITLVDAWVLPADQLRGLSVAMWTPIDHEPVPPKVLDHVKRSGALPVAMSRHGRDQMIAAGLEPMYAPHGIDTNVMQPRGKSEWRRTIRPEVSDETFVVGMVAANKGEPSRKGFELAFQAFAEFHKHHEDSLLYIHSEATGAVNGVNLIELSKACGIPPGAILFTPQYAMVTGMAPEAMASIFSSFDVLVNPALGEGFGIPVVEAQACGVPVIVTDWTAMSELCGAGWKVGGQRTYTTQRSWAKTASVPELTRALKAARTGAAQKAPRARDFALAYDADKVYADYWRPIIKVFEDRFAGRTTATGVPTVDVVPA